MGISAGALGVVGALGGMFGGGFGSPGSIAPFSTPYSPYISPSTIASQAGSTAGNIGTLTNQAMPVPQLIYPMAQNSLSNLYENNYASSYLKNAAQAAAMGRTGATTAFNAGQNLYTPGFQTIQAGQSLVPFASAIETQAFDPQSALYNRTLQQLRDQINVANAQSGVSTSPYGASVEANALGNFNIDWQNNLLNRMATGANAASGLINTAAGATRTGAGVIGDAAQIAGTAPLSYTQASGMPYQVSQGIYGDQFNALNNYISTIGGSQGPANTQIENMLSLVGAENQTNAQAVQAYEAILSQYNANLNAQKQTFGENAMLGSALGRSLAGIGGGFGGGTGGNVWSGLNFNNSPLWQMGYNAFNPLPAAGAFG